MPEPEKKPDVQPQPAPAGAEPKPTPEPNQGPSAEELRKQNEQLQQQLKERDAQIADLNTTKATIEARQKEIDDAAKKGGDVAKVQDRVKKIMETASLDPEEAAKELTSLLTEVQSNASKSAVIQAQQAIQFQTTIDKLRAGVKASNPDFDDDIVDVIMDRANMIATTGKYKTADEAIKAATDFVKSKFEGYAQKKNSAPPLPDGALAEAGGNRPPEKPKPETIITPEQEIETRKSGMQKKIL